MRTLILYLLKLAAFTLLGGVTVSHGIENEKPIVFKSNSGEETDAFEGHFFVAENRNNPNSRKIRVNYVRFPSLGKQTAPPIVYLSGGPGGSGIATAKWRRFPMFMALRQFGDVIALDQRGTGASEAVDACKPDKQLPEGVHISADTYLTRYQDAAKHCLSHWQAQGVDIYGYNTVQNAMDLNDLRVHLGTEKVTLWGISYGTHLALAATKLFPDHIHKLVLASAEGLDQTVKLPAQTDVYLSRVQAVINQQALVKRVPDLKALMHRVHKKAQAKPFEITLKKKSGETVKVYVSDYTLQRFSSYMIADPGINLSMLIQLYLTLDADVTDMLVGLLQRVGFADEKISFRLMPLAMDIASGVTPARLAQIKTQSQNATLGLALNFPMPQLINVDGHLDLGDEFRTRPEAATPTILFSGTLDGRTYPESQAKAIAGLSHATQIIVEHAGHNLLMSSPEVLERIEQFLADKALNTTAIQLPLPDLTFRMPR